MLSGCIRNLCLQKWYFSEFEGKNGKINEKQRPSQNYFWPGLFSYYANTILPPQGLQISNSVELISNSRYDKNRGCDRAVTPSIFVCFPGIRSVCKLCSPWDRFCSKCSQRLTLCSSCCTMPQSAVSRQLLWMYRSWRSLRLPQLRRYHYQPCQKSLIKKLTQKLHSYTTLIIFATLWKR